MMRRRKAGQARCRVPRTRRPIRRRPGSVLVAGLTLVVTACLSGPDAADESPAGQGAGSLSVFDLEVGMCFDRSPEDPEDGEEFVSLVALVDCGEQHEFEVYSVFEVRQGSGASFPGIAQLQDDVALHCGAEFEAYVGRPYAHSEYIARFITPTEDSWAQNDRTAACYLTSQEGWKIGSARHSDR